MTPARKSALEFFHNFGEVCIAARHMNRPGRAMVTRMLNDGELEEEQRGGAIFQRLTDIGRQRLHEG